MLEFEALGYRNNIIDLRKVLQELKYKICRNNDGELRSGADAANTDEP